MVMTGWNEMLALFVSMPLLFLVPIALVALLAKAFIVDRF